MLTPGPSLAVPGWDGDIQLVTSRRPALTLRIKTFQAQRLYGICRHVSVKAKVQLSFR